MKTDTTTKIAEEEITLAQPVSDLLDAEAEDSSSEAGSAAASTEMSDEEKIPPYIKPLRIVDIEQIKMRLPKNPEDEKTKIRLTSKVVLELPKLKTGNIQDSKTADWAKKRREEGLAVAESIKINIWLQPPEGQKLSVETMKKLRQIDELFRSFFAENFPGYEFYSPLKNIDKIGEVLQVNLKKSKFDKPVYRDGNKANKIIAKLPQEIGFVNGAFFINIYKMEADGNEICGWTIKPAEVVFYAREVKPLEIKLSDEGKNAY